MKVGCFALIDPFTTLEHQLERIAGMGFKYTDVTDSHPGSSLGRDYGFAATASLDGNPMDLKRLFDKHGLTATTVCAHATLLDPVLHPVSAPMRSNEAIMLAAGMGVPYVITTERHPQTSWAENLSFDEKILVVIDKLYEPARLAHDMGVKILLEPHGPVTDFAEGLRAIMDGLGNSVGVGVNMDTGNSWLGGSDPVELAKELKDQIYHIHWKDLPEEWEEQRGKMWGCGMGPIALGDGVIDVAGVFEVLNDSPNIEHTTLEAGGDGNMLKSYEYLKALGAE